MLGAELGSYGNDHNSGGSNAPRRGGGGKIQEPNLFTDPTNQGRLPDYISGTINIGTPTLGWSGNIVLDRYGNVYVSPIGGNIGKSSTPISFSLTVGRLNQPYKTKEPSLIRFLSGHGRNISAGALFGSGVTSSPGNGKAFEYGIFTPQGGYSEHYSWWLLKLGIIAW